MRFISTRVHGVLDYLLGIVLIAAPWILGFAKGGAETIVPVVLGASALIYSLCTKYEAGAVKLISMPAHLTIDFIAGALLAVSPWLFGFSDHVHLPHLILGILEMGAALMTQTVPSGDARHHQQAGKPSFSH